MALLGLGSRRQGAAEEPRSSLRNGLATIPGRAEFEQRAAAEISRARRRNTSVTLFCLDLEGFGRVRDELGVAVAKDTLRRVSFEALSALRGEDTLAHLGGGRFVVLAPEISREDERRVLARITSAIERAVPGHGALRGVTATAGSACYPGSGQTVAALIATAREDLESMRPRRRAAEDRLDLALVEEASLAECALEVAAREPRRGASAYSARQAAVAGALGGSALLAAWFALAAAPATDTLRPILAAAAQLAAVGATVHAARATAARERIGWALVSAGLVLWFVPLAGLPAGLASACGLLLVIDGRWIEDRYRLFDSIGASLAVAVVSVSLLAPALLDAADPSVTMIASRASVGILGAAITAAAVLTLYWTPLRSRPDAWLMALAYLVAVAATSPWSILMTTTTFLPTEAWEVGVPLAGTMIATAAMVRIALGEKVPESASNRDVRTRDGALIGDLLIAIVAGAVVLGGRPLTAVAIVPLLVGIIVMRDLRSRLLERDRRDLKRTALRSQHELALQWQANLAVLSAALEARDGYTGRHSTETVRLARKVSKRLGLSNDAVEEVCVAALLHDIGKIGVPDDVLKKKGPLSEKDWRVMREHPVTGERILRAVPGLEKTARAIRHEHERWDGEGYPDGLSGDEIPLASRIVFACDAFHAMISDRPYRPALTAEAACARLEEGAGSQFDPAAVHALLEVLRSPRQEGRTSWMHLPRRRRAAVAGAARRR